MIISSDGIIQLVIEIHNENGEKRRKRRGFITRCANQLPVLITLPYHLPLKDAVCR
jgi:hypothetical protein